jgi:hypothetical protein
MYKDKEVNNVNNFFVSQENYMKYKEQFDSLSKRMIIIKKEERKGKNKNDALCLKDNIFLNPLSSLSLSSKITFRTLLSISIVPLSMSGS